MRNISLVPECDVFQTDETISPNYSSQTTNSLRDNRIAFVRHGARALLTFRKTLLRLAHFGALPVPDVEGKLIKRRSNDPQGAQVFSVAIALDDLRRDSGDFQSQSFANAFLDNWI